MPDNVPSPPPPPPTTPSTAPLQFDVAQYSGDQALASSTCAACKRPIAHTYYTANQAIVCPECNQQLAQQLTGGSGFGRFCGALGLGILGGLAGAILWYAVGRLTGYTIGLIAIVVGVLVGMAVRKGCHGRGGWLYQSMAIVLTYLCICLTHVPDLVDQLLRGMDNQSGIVQVEGDPSESGAANAPATSDEPAPEISPAVRTILAYAFAIPLSLIVPFYGGIISILLIGFALYEAWKINKRLVIQSAGPFHLGPPAPAPPPVSINP